MTDTPVQERFKQAMGLYPATVNVISAQHEGQRQGMTATAVCSLTMDPPQILACVNKSTTSHECIVESGHFCVNVLERSQEDISNVFASPADPDKPDKYERGGTWKVGIHELPLLEDALANIQCQLSESIDTATHSIFIGTVLEVRFSPDAPPLVYCNRGYTGLAD